MRIGLDVGGTFTDTVAVDESSREIRVWKHRTTYEHLPNGVMAALEDVRREEEAVSAIVHGTTLVSNAIIQRRGALTGVIATRGFRDLLEIRRNRRQYLYAIYWDKPPTLVRRMLRREVDERLDRDGNVVVPLDEESVRQAVRFLKHKGVTSYAVCLLFAFKNPLHESRVREIIQEEHPGADVSLSCEVAPEIREFERTSTTALNAMVRPVIREYLAELEREISELGWKVPLHIMKANGGVARPETVRNKAIEAYESGPAAGVTAAVALGQETGIGNLITFDMGGTTTDVSIIFDGKPVTTLDSEIEWSIPVKIPMIFVRSVGAGGGSIASIDRGGALRVGPESAGSDPGPVAYGWGGTRPTVTDANLILGRLPERLLGGTMELGLMSARRAVDVSIGEPLNWSTEKAAEAISRIALMNMVQLVREMTVGQGYDPRDFTLVAFGGNGPQYAAEVAAELDIREVVVPFNASVFSALGCLYADIRHEYVQTLFAPAEPVTRALLDRIDAASEAMRARAYDDLALDGVTEEPMFTHEFDMRYVGEAYEIKVAQERGGALDAGALHETVEKFHAEHARLYGFSREDPVEILNVRLVAVVPVAKPAWPELNGNGAEPASAIKERRPIFIDGDHHLAQIYDRGALPAGAMLQGPCIVEEAQATTFVPVGWTARIDRFGLRLAAG